MNRPVVFLGPTLPIAEARTLLDADFLPPARGTDLLRALVQRRPSAIGVVDGLFEQVPSLRHKEVLYALTQRVPVYGASSMGALRAAELAEFGMIGVGSIYHGYIVGRYVGDDEVALNHAAAEHEWQPLSVPLVNLRWGLELAVARGLVTPRTATLVLEVGRELFYADRTWIEACAKARRRGADPDETADLLDFVAEHRPDLKAEDARALLRRMHDDGTAGFTAPEPQFAFEATAEFLGWLRDAGASS